MRINSFLLLSVAQFQKCSYSISKCFVAKCSIEGVRSILYFSAALYQNLYRSLVLIPSNLSQPRESSPKRVKKETGKFREHRSTIPQLAFSITWPSIVCGTGCPAGAKCTFLCVNCIEYTIAMMPDLVHPIPRSPRSLSSRRGTSTWRA